MCPPGCAQDSLPVCLGVFVCLLSRLCVPSWIFVLFSVLVCLSARLPQYVYVFVCVSSGLCVPVLIPTYASVCLLVSVCLFVCLSLVCRSSSLWVCARVCASV